MIRQSSQRTRGFTLIELLAVILILSILVGVLLVSLRDGERGVKMKTTQQLLAKLGSAAESYRNDKGSAPPSSFQAGQEVGNDGLNVGIEAFVVALWSNKYDAGGLLPDEPDRMINNDEDNSTKQLTDFEKRGLLEIPDAWGSPIAYIERSDYALTNRRYRTFDADTGEQIDAVVVAFKNATTGQYYSAQGFQFISAGPDCVFGTEDDITAFDRE
jgi:prepilin-type N-terminal cleavage/methylation domain-containing protein